MLRVVAVALRGKRRLFVDGRGRVEVSTGEAITPQPPISRLATLLKPATDHHSGSAYSYPLQLGVLFDLFEQSVVRCMCSYERQVEPRSLGPG